MNWHADDRTEPDDPGDELGHDDPPEDPRERGLPWPPPSVVRALESDEA